MENIDFDFGEFAIAVDRYQAAINTVATKKQELLLAMFDFDNSQHNPNPYGETVLLLATQLVEAEAVAKVAGVEFKYLCRLLDSYNNKGEM